MPRVSPQNLVWIVLTVGSFFFIIINIHVHTSSSNALWQVEDVNFLGSELLRNPLSLGSPKTSTPHTEIHEENEAPFNLENKPWYMHGGKVRPSLNHSSSLSLEAAKLFPEDKPGDDRLREQLMVLPPGPLDSLPSSDDSLKKILFWNGVTSWGVRAGRGVFLKEECPISSCVIATARKEFKNSDLVIFKDHFVMPTQDRPKNQLWMIFMLESPLHTQVFRPSDVFNWTATYRADSTVVAPYEKWEYYDESIKSLSQIRNYATNKTKKVAWFVSNCKAKNSRLEYAKELSNHIEVDIFGQCGSKNCPRSSQACLNKLNTEYKFYLAFENSNCVDYITEKFFVNGLKYDVLPIVMGARKEDYERVSPHNSFIHVDDFKGAKELAEYLHLLDKDDNLYNSYFAWKGTGEMINTKFFCRICALLHTTKARPEPRSYPDMNKWWREEVCVTGSWNKVKKLKNKEESTKIE